MSVRELTENEVNVFLKSEGPKVQRDLFYCNDDRLLLAKTKVAVEVLVDTHIGIKDREAGVKFKIDPEKMGFVYEEGGNEFHRLNCQQIQQIPLTKRKYAETIQLTLWRLKLKRCDICKPDIRKNVYLGCWPKHPRKHSGNTA